MKPAFVEALLAEMVVGSRYGKAAAEARRPDEKAELWEQKVQRVFLRLDCSLEGQRWGSVVAALMDCISDLSETREGQWDLVLVNLNSQFFVLTLLTCTEPAASTVVLVS